MKIDIRAKMLLYLSSYTKNDSKWSGAKLLGIF